MFSNEQLKKLIEGQCVGKHYPYNTNNEDEIEGHIRRLFYRLKRIPNLIVEAEWSHFGSGYASFVEFFCYRKEDVVTEDDSYGFRHFEIRGLIVDISRLAPVAIMGEDERNRTIRVETNEFRNGAWSNLIGGSPTLEVDEKYQEMAKAIQQALAEFDIQLLDKVYLNQPLPFKANIPTIYRESKDYLIMDAIFYWED